MSLNYSKNNQRYHDFDSIPNGTKILGKSNTDVAMFLDIKSTFKKVDDLESEIPSATQINEKLISDAEVEVEGQNISQAVVDFFNSDTGKQDFKGVDGNPGNPGTDPQLDHPLDYDTILTTDTVFHGRASSQDILTLDKALVVVFSLYFNFEFNFTDNSLKTLQGPDYIFKNYNEQPTSLTARTFIKT